MNERITPLPKPLIEIKFIHTVQTDKGSKYALSDGESDVAECEWYQDAVDIKNALDNYPKLEALNAELVEALEFVLENYGVPSHIYDSGRHKAIVETLQKAKGG